MGRARTRRKNAHKRRRRRAFAAINAEIRAHVCLLLGVPVLAGFVGDSRRWGVDWRRQEEGMWTPETLELERMREEEARQRTHDKWCAAVDKSAREFDKQRRVREERKDLVRSIRQIVSGRRREAGGMASAAPDRGGGNCDRDSSKRSWTPRNSGRIKMVTRGALAVTTRWRQATRPTTNRDYCRTRMLVCSWYDTHPQSLSY
jgi:hypothetical protein